MISQYILKENLEQGPKFKSTPWQHESDFFPLINDLSSRRRDLFAFNPVINQPFLFGNFMM